MALLQLRHQQADWRGACYADWQELLTGGRSSLGVCVELIHRDASASPTTRLTES